MTSEDSPQAPDFNGLPEEVFSGGTKLFDDWLELDEQTRVAVLPVLLDHITYQLLGDGTTAEQAAMLSQTFEDSAARLRGHEATLQTRDRPFTPRPEDE